MRGVIIVLMAILGVIFPKFLVKAIKSTDRNDADGGLFRLIRKMLERRIKNEIPNKTHIMQSCIHLHSNSRMRTMGI